jgi:alkanesulfonate monooxygenase SsuD/methylene tetrahydromethanopterin reductase-like flavin-dependent oxidoreductase (luciferase family)
MRTRGRTFDRQLAELVEHWSGSTGVGPSPAQGSRPGVLIGGRADVAFRRAARWADGWTMGGGSPEGLAGALEKLRAAWSEQGREGTPRVVALMYFSLGPNAEADARASLGGYYAYLGEYADAIVAGAAKDEATVREYVAGFEQAGADELICFPSSADPVQVDLLAQALR